MHLLTDVFMAYIKAYFSFTSLAKSHAVPVSGLSQTMC